MQRDDATTDLFGLAGTFPRPGWVVLDAARDHRFTGELRFDTSPPASVYFDRGRIYLAERVTDPSLGARLVDAGAITAAQLERGAVRIGSAEHRTVEHRTVEHLGHLFERVPTLDRHTVVVTADLMTEECVGWLASQRVPEVEWIPYRHHESGIQRWDRPWSELAPGDPLPAPSVDEAPVSAAPPPSGRAAEALRTDGHDDRHDDRAEPFLDGLIEWDEPSWLDGSELADEPLEPRDGPTPVDPSGGARPDQDERVVSAEASTPERPDTSPDRDADRNDTPPADADWIDRLAADGLPDADPFTAPKPLPRLPVESVERFELVWPSGEIDEDFGAVDSVVGNGHDPDADRVGATTRLGRPPGDAAPALATSAPVDERAGATDVPHDGAADDEPSDEIVLAVRRAVASIEVGSLAARQRLADRHDAFGTAGADDPGPVPAPGRVAVRSGRNDWSRRTVTRSVFDEPVVEPETAPEPDPTPDAREHHERRAGALRRLISSLRR